MVFKKNVIVKTALLLTFFTILAVSRPISGFAADYTIAGSQTTSQVVATGDTVTVTGTGDLNMAAVKAIAIDGRTADNVTVTVQTGGNVAALGGNDYADVPYVSFNTIYLRNDATITVQAGATVSNTGMDSQGDGSIYNTAIVTGTNAVMSIAGSVATNRFDTGYNNWSPGISAGAGSSITIASGGSVSSDSTGGSGIFLASGGTITNSGTISSSTGVANTATVCITAGSSTITNNGTIDSGASGNRAIHFGTAGTETGNILNLYGPSSITGMLVNQGAAGGATVNFGYTGSAADGAAATTITGNIGSVNNSWNGRVWGGTSTVVGTTNFNTLQVDSGSTLDLRGSSTIAALSGAGTIKNDSASDITITEGDSTSTTFSGSIRDGATKKIALTKQGAGTLTLTGANTYSGVTTVNAGKLLLDHGTSVSHDYSATSGISIASDATFEINQTSGIARCSNVSKTVTGAGTFSKTGAGETHLANDTADTITTFNQSAGGLIDVQAGTLSYFITAASNLGSLTVASGTSALLDNDDQQGADAYFDALNGGGNISYAAGAAARIITLGVNDGGGIFSGQISNGSSTAVSLDKEGTGTLTLSGASTYTGGTTINSGTLIVSNSGAVGTGDLTVSSGATLDVGTTSLGIGSNTYTQASGSTLSLTANSSSTYGQVTTGILASVNSGSTVSVTVGGYIPNNAILTILDTGGSGIGSAPTTVNSSSSLVNFIASSSGGNLILTASRSSGGFQSLAGNANEANVGSVLDNVTNPTSDMTNVLNAMGGLSTAGIDNAMNSMQPDASGATMQVSQATLQQLTQAILGHQEALRGSYTGVSTGSESVSEALKGLDVWAQGYGSYLHQDPRQLSQGYDATVWGTVLGFDLPIIDLIRAGTCFGFAQDYVRGKDNSNRNDINFYQWTIYGEYAKDAFYMDLSGAFAYNTNDASRKVTIGGLSERTASADYSGQQYQVYVEAGYTFNCRKDLKFKSDLNITPLASFEYQHLYLEKYTETGADSMNLTVKAQNYDFAQTGFGVKLDYPLDTKYGQLVPELRFIWLYDWIGDSQQTTANFNGGGGSFATNGFDPAQSTWDMGAKLTMYTKNNWALAANYEFQLKEDFYGHYGYLNARYNF